MLSASMNRITSPLMTRDVQSFAFELAVVSMLSSRVMEVLVVMVVNVLGSTVGFPGQVFWFFPEVYDKDLLILDRGRGVIAAIGGVGCDKY